MKNQLYSAVKICPALSNIPRSVADLNYKSKILEILGRPVQIYLYDTPFKVDTAIPTRFIDEKNYDYIQTIFNKYRINPSEFINKFANPLLNGSSLFIKNDKKTIMDKESLVQLEAKIKIEQFDIQFIESNLFGLNRRTSVELYIRWMLLPRWIFAEKAGNSGPMWIWRMLPNS